MSVTLKVATQNYPHRILIKDRAAAVRTFQRLANRGCDVIVGQEQTDTDPKVVCPKGWQFYRPKAARHNVVYWNPKTVTKKRVGRVKVNKRTGPKWVRFIVWAHVVKQGKPARVGGIHLPAFKTSRPANADEFRHQERLLAKWLNGGKNRILAGDFNARIPNDKWTPNLTRVGRWSKQVVSGPHKAKIDYAGSSKKGQWYPVKTETMASKSDHKAVIVTFEWR